MIRKILCCLLFIIHLFSCNEKKRFITSYPDGKIKTSWHYETDTLTGTKTGYWPNGNISYVVMYLNGTPSGEFSEYYENGFISRKGQFLNGQLSGKRFKYSSKYNGRVLGEEYIMNVKGRPYYFYIKEFDDQGALVKFDHYLDLEPDKIAGNIIFRYAGKEVYDSMKIVVGDFSSEFKSYTDAKLDTFNFINNEIKIPVPKLQADSINVVRGKFFGYKTFNLNTDSIGINVRTQYYEFSFDDLDSINDQILLKKKSET
jgi:hypothetical protein